MLTRDQAKAKVQEHGSIAAAAKKCGVARSTFQYYLKGQPVPSTGKGRTIAEFRASHDKNYIVPRKIAAALAVLGEGWEYEQKFSQLAGVSLAELAAYRSAFEDHVVLVDRSKRLWAGTRSMAQKMREMVS